MTWTHPAYEAVVNGLGARTGLTFSQERHAHAEIGVRRAMSRAGTSDPERYRRLLADDESLLDDLIVELTVGETYFFREPAQFEFIRRVVLPGLRLDRGRAHPGQIWSAGLRLGRGGLLTRHADRGGEARRPGPRARDRHLPSRPVQGPAGGLRPVVAARGRRGDRSSTSPPGGEHVRGGRVDPKKHFL